MEKSKRKIHDNIRPYWYVFLPLMIALAIMIYFPLRIALDELLLDTIFYGTIMLACIISAIHVYRRFRKRSRRLVVIILLCVFLSGWQVFDLNILRGAYLSPQMGNTIYYSVRFTNDEIICHNYTEQYIGNDIIALVYDIDRNASWFRCGG